MTELTKKIVIAVDGYSSCGKSSYAKLIASELSYLYIDSGAMYRAVTFYALNNSLVTNGFILRQKELIKHLGNIVIEFRTKDSYSNYHTFLNGVDIEDDIRNVAVSEVVSLVSKIPEVREYLVHLQQEMGRDKGIVMDGRDIGTVVFPQAEMKIFMTADVEVRARRRFDELKGKGMDVSFDEIKKNIKKRDYNDENRKVSPLRKADDALILDNSYMSFDDQMLWFKQRLKEKGYLRS